MENESTELGIYVDGDAVMIVGNEGDIERLIAHLSGGSGLKGRALANDARTAVAGLAGMASPAQAGSGRWVRLTPDAAARLQQLAGPDWPGTGTMAGVLRASGGRIDQHTRFVPPGSAALDPAGLSIVAAMALQLSLQQSAEELGKYLETMDVQLDQLLQSERAEAMGEIRGITRIISEAFDTYQQTGRVPSASWDTVQQHPTSLASFAAQSLAQFDSMTEQVSQGPVAEKAKAAQQLAADELPFWLSILAVSLINQKRFHILELAWVHQEHPEDAEAHREVITKHNQAMAQNVARALQRLTAALEQAGRVGDLDRALQPISAADLVRAVNQAHDQIGKFVSVAQIGPLVWANAAAKDWSQSVADLAQKGGGAVGGVVKGIFTGVRGIAERAILEQAKRIEAEQAARKAQRGPGKDIDPKGPDRG
jgi:hypothetical protein